MLHVFMRFKLRVLGLNPFFFLCLGLNLLLQLSSEHLTEEKLLAKRSEDASLNFSK